MSQPRGDGHDKGFSRNTNFWVGIGVVVAFAVALVTVMGILAR